jgi:hypothetical protein
MSKQTKHTKKEVELAKLALKALDYLNYYSGKTDLVFNMQKEMKDILGVTTHKELEELMLNSFLL